MDCRYFAIRAEISVFLGCLELRRQQSPRLPEERRLTINEMGNKAMRGPVYQVTLSRDADRCQDVVSCAHDLPDASAGELVDGTRRPRFQLVLEDDEAHEPEVGLDLRA